MFKRVIDLLRTGLDLETEGSQEDEKSEDQSGQLSSSSSKSKSGSIHIDGDVVGKMRDLSLAAFKKQDHCNILFISYKIGAESLNLSEANHIILMEPWWCPAVIEQAKARCHRMGQTKETHIYELFIKKVHISPKEVITGTIEQAIIRLCKQKIEGAQQFYKEGKPLKGQGKSSGLSAQDLAQILYQ
jgi:SNF2 family DNA or RNA helicase